MTLRLLFRVVLPTVVIMGPFSALSRWSRFPNARSRLASVRVLVGAVRSSNARLLLVKKAPPFDATIILSTLLPLVSRCRTALVKSDRNAVPTAPVFRLGLLTAKAMTLLVLPL